MLLKVNAKINLSLDITGKKDNGYHMLDMVMTSITLSDIITLNKREDNICTVKYVDGRTYPNDVCLKASDMLIKKYNFTGADIVIEKHIPEKSGLGGSSSDASGVIFGLAKLNNYPIENIDINDILSIGSDVYYMLFGGTRRVQGTGEIVGSIIDVPIMNFVLLTDTVGVDTATSYKTYSSGYSRYDNSLFIKYLQEGSSKIKDCFNNALYDSSRLLNTAIDDKIALLKKAGSVSQFMTGSGSGVVGYFEKNIDNKTKDIIKQLVNEKYSIFYINNTNKGIEILG